MTTTVASPSTHNEQGEARIQPRGLIQRFIFSRLDAFERYSRVSAEYCRWMANVSPRAFFKFGKLGKLAQFRHALPADASAVAHLVAARSEDCGPCVQISVNFALRDGVSKDIVRAVLDRQPDRLPPKLADVYRFADCVVSGGDDDTLRDRDGPRDGGRPYVSRRETDDRLRQELFAGENRDLDSLSEQGNWGRRLRRPQKLNSWGRA
jgi:hypothetical protein